MQNFLTEFQECEYLRAAALPGCNSLGGPGWRQFEAVLALPERDRAPVLRAFADEVHFRMSVDQRLAIEAAVAHHFDASINSHEIAWSV